MKVPWGAVGFAATWEDAPGIFVFFFLNKRVLYVIYVGISILRHLPFPFILRFKCPFPPIATKWAFKKSYL